jgi:dienelactone hydrolase
MQNIRSNKRLIAGLLLPSLLALSCWSIIAFASKKSDNDTHNEKAQMFAYDQSRAFDLKEESARAQNGVTVRDLSYAAYAAKHGRIKAFLIQPPGTGPFAGIVFFHWLGEEKSDRTEFLDEAIALGKRGTASLLIQGFFPWTEKPTDGPTDHQQIIDQTIEVRRALDLLLSQPRIDKRRIGFVGHDYGSMFGAISSGIDKRVKTYVIIAGMGTFSDWSLKYWKAPSKNGAEAYTKAVKDVDPIGYISRAAPATVLFQFANNDKYITKEVAEAFFAAASKPKEVKWYQATHDLDVDEARKDRREWLTKQLRLRG